MVADQSSNKASVKKSPMHNENSALSATQDIALTVTADAAAHLKTILARHPGSVGLRLKIKRSGCSGFMYAPEVADDMQDHEIMMTMTDDLKILVSQEDIDLIRGTEIAVVTKQLKQKQIVFNNPNAINSCGCGESFAVRDKDDT